MLKNCSHGRGWDETCTSCDVVWTAKVSRPMLTRLAAEQGNLLVRMDGILGLLLHSPAYLRTKNGLCDCQKLRDDIQAVVRPNASQPPEAQRVELKLRWGDNKRSDGTHIEWHAPCGCAYHPEPFPHVHPCSDAHKRPDLHE